MTDSTQELDEILNDFAYSAVDDSTSLGILDPDSVNKAKQAILDWHNKQVEAVLDRLDKETERCQDGCWVSIKAERNKLKEPSND